MLKCGFELIVSPVDCQPVGGATGSQGTGFGPGGGTRKNVAVKATAGTCLGSLLQRRQQQNMSTLMSDGRLFWSFILFV